MGTDNWARGTIKLPAKAYPGVRDALIQWHNEKTEHLRDLALKVYEQVKTLKVKRGTDRAKLLECEWARDDALGSGSNLECLLRRVDHEGQGRIADSIFPRKKNSEGRWERAKRPCKPKKKDFPLATKSTKEFSAQYGEPTITLDPKTKVITFNAYEGKSAQDHAMESDLTRALFRALKSVAWTSRTGGKILGNDEHNEDAGRDYEGGGGSYVLKEWSKKKSEQARAYARPGYRYGRGW